MDRLISWWLINTHKIAPVLVLLLALSLYGISKLQMVYDFEAFFPKGDPDLEFYNEYKSDFGPDDSNLYIAIHQPQGIFNPTFLQRFDSLTKVLDSLPYVEQVMAINRVKNPIKTPFGFSQRQVLHVDEPSLYPADSIRIMEDERLLIQMVSEDAKTLVIVLTMQNPLEQEEANKVTAQLKPLLEDFFPGQWYFAGKAVIQAEYVRIQVQEVIFFTIMSGLLVLVMLWYIYRRPWPIVLALGTVMMALFYFLGILGWLGIPLDLMSALFPILMLIVGLSDVIHILARYQECLREGNNQQAAFKHTVKDIGLAVLLTSVTTAIGFLSLSTSSISPVQMFGYTAALGVMVAYATAIVVVPTCIMWLKPASMQPKRPSREVDSIVAWSYRFSRDHENLILKATGILFVVGVIGLSLINTEARLQNDLPRREKLKTDFMFFEENLGGFRSFEVALLPQGNKTIHHPEVLQAIDDLEKYLRNRDEVHAILSPIVLYKSLHRAHHADRVAYYTMPDDSATLSKYKKLLTNNTNNISRVLIGQDAKVGRLAGRVNDVGSDSISIVYDDLRSWVAANISAEVMKIRITGSALLYDNNNKYLISGLLKGISLAFGIISLIMVIYS